MTVHLLNFKDKTPTGLIVNTTSRSDNWTKGLSPFSLGPVVVYPYDEPHASLNMENAWQFSKVYPVHVDGGNNPTDAYLEWAKKGWADSFAHRYPMGKGFSPLYSLWKGKHLSYIEARREIYIPLYAEAVGKTGAFQKLKELYETMGEIWLLDFDAYDHRRFGMDYDEVIKCETMKMGHAFVLAMMLEDVYERNLTESSRGSKEAEGRSD